MSANTNEMTDESLVDTMPVKHKSLIASIIKFSVLSIFMVIAVFGGLLVGKIIVGKLDTFDPTKYSAENYIESQSNIALWSTKQIGDLTPTQIFVVAQARLSNCSYYGVYTKGYNGEDKGVVTTLGMKQDLYGYRYVVDGNGYFDYYSTGLATVVKKVEYKVGEDKFYCYEGVIKNGTTTWTLKMAEDGKDYRNAVEYKQMVGCDADNPIDYIISTKTVKEEKSNGVKDGLHSFTLKLDPSTSVLYYVKKMKYMSGFDYPKFKDIEIKFEVDDQMNLQNMYINENYLVLGMDANSKYKMEFHYESVEVR